MAYVFCALSKVYRIKMRYFVVMGRKNCFISAQRPYHSWFQLFFVSFLLLIRSFYFSIENSITQLLCSNICKQSVDFSSMLFITLLADSSILLIGSCLSTTPNPPLSLTILHFISFFCRFLKLKVFFQNFSVSTYCWFCF